MYIYNLHTVHVQTTVGKMFSKCRQHKSPPLIIARIDESMHGMCCDGVRESSSDSQLTGHRFNAKAFHVHVMNLGKLFTYTSVN